MPERHGAWVRYGDPVTDQEIEFAIEHYRVAILQPFETRVLERLKAARSDLMVLCYKCLSSTRDYENGSIITSGVSFEEAEEAGEEWFAHRVDNRTRIEWNTYPGHWQMAVWEQEYQQRWIDNVADELEDSLWDGVMADNDVFDDYYGLNPPIEGGREMVDIRRTMDAFIPRIGERLNSIGKVLIPNIAESRREPGRWERHAAYGGGFEEVWLAYGADDYLPPEAVLAQVEELHGPGLTIARTASDGSDQHPNFLYGLATFWVFGGRGRAAFTATAHDGYSTTPFIPQLDWDLGEPIGEPRQRGNGWSRSFANGWAAVNLNSARRRKIAYEPPPGLMNASGTPAPHRIIIGPHEGVLLVRDPMA